MVEKQRKCKDCNVELIAGENWPFCHQRKKFYVCRNCENKRTSEEYHNRPELRERILTRTKKYQKAHPEVGRKAAMAYHRRHSLTTDGITYYGLSKRPHPKFCEVCGNPYIKRLGYHHWDDNDKNKGVWVCRKCHYIIEQVDNRRGKSIIPLYLKVKAQIEQESKTNP
jgi:rubrerythrin